MRMEKKRMEIHHRGKNRRAYFAHHGEMKLHYQLSHQNT